MRSQTCKRLGVRIPNVYGKPAPANAVSGLFALGRDTVPASTTSLRKPDGEQDQESGECPAVLHGGEGGEPGGELHRKASCVLRLSIDSIALVPATHRQGRRRSPRARWSGPVQAAVVSAAVRPASASERQQGLLHGFKCFEALSKPGAIELSPTIPPE